MQLPWKIRKILTFIVGYDNISNRSIFKPSFSYKSFSELPLNIDYSNSWEQDVITLFLNKSDNIFSYSFENIISVSEQLQYKHPEFCSRIIANASTIVNSHLPIYSDCAPPIDNNFGWKALKKGLHNDQLYLSRPQRFGFAPVLAQAALFDIQYAEKLGSILESWKSYASSCPHRWPYNSNHAVIYRIIALCWCWLFLGSIRKHKPAPSLDTTLYNIINIIRNDILFLVPRIGKSHPNNHLLADYFAGWLLNQWFPELIPETADFSHYEEKWQQELLRQFYPDGGCFEHAIHYHEHGCEMAIMYRLTTSQPLPEEVEARIKSMLQFQVKLNGPHCKPWPLGDTTEDTLLPLDITTGWSPRTIQHIYNDLYPESPPSIHDDQSDYKAFWLLKGKYPQLNNTADRPLSFNVFLDSGLFQWTDIKGKNELLYRTGVPEHVSFMPGHMCADTLSLYWRHNGIDLLAPPGTFTYKFTQNKEDNYRQYFCGPWSHNGVIINDEDPLGVLNGDFRDNDNGLRVKHSVYGDPEIASLCTGEILSNNIYDGLRRGVLNFDEQHILIIDLLTKQQSAKTTYSHWLSASGVKMAIENESIALKHDSSCIGRISLPSSSESRIYNGHKNPIRGWRSDQYGKLQATDQLVVKHPLGSQHHTTLLTLDQDINQFEENHSPGQKSVVVKFNCKKAKNIIYINLSDTMECFKYQGISLAAKAILIREHYHQATTIIALDCQSLVPDEGDLKHESLPKGVVKISRETTDSIWSFDT